MARHRNIRSMKYDEYDSYDDVYGHSLEEDTLSPSDSAFIYRREGAQNQQKIGQFIGIGMLKESDQEEDVESDLSEEDKSKLEKGIKQLRETLQDTVPRNEMVNCLIENDFNVEKCLNILLDISSQKEKIVERKEKDDNSNQFQIGKNFTVPKLKFNTNLVDFTNTTPKKPFVTRFNAPFESKNPESRSYTSLAELTSSHLEKANVINFKDGKDVKAITTKLSGLRIKRPDGVKQINSVKEIDLAKEIDLVKEIDLAKEIDLSLAVTTSKTSINSRSKDAGEDFELPYTECDVDSPKKPGGKKRRAVEGCVVDSSKIRNVKCDLLGGPSCFGKVLCLRYGSRSPVLIAQPLNKHVKVFRFDTPSPDDHVSQHLKR